MTFRFACLSLALSALATTAVADSPDAAAPTAPVSATAPAPAPASAPAVAPIGQAAPDFTLTDTDGQEISLSSLKGKVVVLEWFNPDCPFVVNAHGEKGVLRGMADAWAGKGVTWLAVNSGAEGKQGHGLERNKAAREGYAMKHPVLLDPTGRVGRAYGAKSTPHVFVVDAKGVLAYKGGVDNAPMGEVPEGGTREPYLQSALEAVTAGKPVAVAETRSYGCSVKYASR